LISYLFLALRFSIIIIQFTLIIILLLIIIKYNLLIKSFFVINFLSLLQYFLPTFNCVFMNLFLLLYKSMFICMWVWIFIFFNNLHEFLCIKFLCFNEFSFTILLLWILTGRWSNQIKYIETLIYLIFSFISIPYFFHSSYIWIVIHFFIFYYLFYIFTLFLFLLSFLYFLFFLNMLKINKLWIFW